MCAAMVDLGSGWAGNCSLALICAALFIFHRDLIMDNLDRFYIAFEDGLFALVIDSLTDKVMCKYPISHMHLAMVQVVHLNRTH
jgi:hypothetical protein